MNNLNSLLTKAHSSLHKLNWLPPLLARITLGVVFVESGWGKIHHIDKVAEFFMSLHIPAANAQAHFVAYLELIGGFLVLIGFCTRLISIPLLFTMVVAILTAKQDDLKEWTDLFGFSEFLYLVLFLWLIIVGAGKVSVDAWLSRKLRN
jgi:putative oxidoreductase